MVTIDRLSVRVAMLVCLAAAPAWAQMEGSPADSTSSLEIGKHRFGLEVIDREIQNEVDAFHVGDVVYLWMRVEGGPSEPIQVSWLHDEFRFDVTLSIGGPSWRTWSRKTLFSAGSWTVRVSDADGNVLLEETLAVADTPRSAGE